MADRPEAIPDALTIVIHLPQPLDKVTAILQALAGEWPDAHFTNGLARLDIPAEP